MRRLSPAADRFGAMPYRDLQQMLDAEMPAGDRYYFTGGFTDGLPDGLIEALARAARERPSARCEIDLHQMGGAVRRVPDADSAYAGRTAVFTFNILAGWRDPADDEAHRDWARATRTAIAPYRVDGGYPNFSTEPGGGEDAAAMYGRRRLGRLRAVKAHWDPGNLFRLNHNIAP
jgi:hypothetical protein